MSWPFFFRKRSQLVAAGLKNMPIRFPKHRPDFETLEERNGPTEPEVMGEDPRADQAGDAAAQHAGRDQDGGAARSSAAPRVDVIHEGTGALPGGRGAAANYDSF